MAKFKKEEHCFYIENNLRIAEAVVISTRSGFCVIKDKYGRGTQLRESRLYRTREEAEKMLPNPPQLEKPITPRKRTIYDEGL